MANNPWALPDDQAAAAVVEGQDSAELDIFTAFITTMELAFERNTPADVRKDLWRIGLLACRKVVRAELQGKFEAWLRKKYFNKDCTKALMASCESGTAHMTKEAMNACQTFLTLIQTLDLEEK